MTLLKIKRFSILSILTVLIFISLLHTPSSGQDQPKTDCAIVRSLCMDVAIGLEMLCQETGSKSTTECTRDAQNFYANCVSGSGCPFH